MTKSKTNVTAVLPASTTSEVTRVKTSRSDITRRIKESGGKFFTVVFNTKEEKNRKMNCVFPKNVVEGAPASQLGYLTVKEVGKGYKNVNSRTLKSAKIEGVEYYV